MSRVAKAVTGVVVVLLHIPASFIQNLIMINNSQLTITTGFERSTDTLALLASSTIFPLV